MHEIVSSQPPTRQGKETQIYAGFAGVRTKQQIFYLRCLHCPRHRTIRILCVPDQCSPCPVPFSRGTTACNFKLRKVTDSILLLIIKQFVVKKFSHAQRSCDFCVEHGSVFPHYTTFCGSTMGRVWCSLASARSAHARMCWPLFCEDSHIRIQYTDTTIGQCAKKFSFPVRDFL